MLTLVPSQVTGSNYPLKLSVLIHIHANMSMLPHEQLILNLHIYYPSRPTGPLQGPSAPTLYTKRTNVAITAQEAADTSMKL